MIRGWLDKRKRKHELARQYAHSTAKKFSEAPWILPEEREKKYKSQFQTWYQVALDMDEGLLRLSLDLDTRAPCNVEENKVETKDSRYISSHVRREVWRRDKGKCALCGSRKNLEFDHIVPVSKGGSNTARNIELLCESCNRAKSNNIG